MYALFPAGFDLQQHDIDDGRDEHERGRGDEDDGDIDEHSQGVDGVPHKPVGAGRNEFEAFVGIDADAPGAAHFSPADEGEDGAEDADDHCAPGGDIGELSRGDEPHASASIERREGGDPYTDQKNQDAGIPKKAHPAPNALARHRVGIFADFPREPHQLHDHPRPINGEADGGDKRGDSFRHALRCNANEQCGEAAVHDTSGGTVLRPLAMPHVADIVHCILSSRIFVVNDWREDAIG